MGKASSQMKAGIREAKIMLSRQGTMRLVCKIAFSLKDASLYVFPYSEHGEYKVGRGIIPGGLDRSDIDLSDTAIVTEVPKISLHESGIAHICTSTLNIGPLSATRFADLSGQHILTVNCHGIDRLRCQSSASSLKSDEAEIVIPVRDDVDSGRLVFYANAIEPKFDCLCEFHFTLKRSSSVSKMFVGAASFANDPAPLPADSWPVSCIMGWSVETTREQDSSFLFIAAR